MVNVIIPVNNGKNSESEIKMKLGIVSIFDNKNIGNRLQNFALQFVCKRYADTVITVKNKPYNSGKSRLLRWLPFAESAMLNHLLGMHRRACNVKFTCDNIELSKSNYWYEKEYLALSGNTKCNLYCAGSDQVWNPHIRSGMFNYLGFAPYDATFSYAASFGVDSIPEQYVEAVRKGLNHIKFISVREDAGKRIVEELTGRTDVQVLVDPTMLLTTREWDKVALKPRMSVPEKYILTYFLGSMSAQRQQAIREKAESMGCEVIALMDKNSPFYVSGPSEFLYLVKHAALVCTDSFHGSVFSFLYGRPLAIFDRKGSSENMSSRLETLASKFNLRDCLVSEEKLKDVKLEADYSQGYAALEAERKKSKAFLDMVFQEAERAGLCK